ncbi:MAG: hypothetical protein IRZ09_11400 [Variibacter sp.]|nr:hypothetical protein [Variibacter sp.]
MAESEQGIIPHLVVDDAAAAIAFYETALGATATTRVPAEDGRRLLHAELTINGARIFLRDDFRPPAPACRMRAPVGPHRDDPLPTRARLRKRWCACSCALGAG